MLCDNEVYNEWNDEKAGWMTNLQLQCGGTKPTLSSGVVPGRYVTHEGTVKGVPMLECRKRTNVFPNKYWANFGPNSHGGITTEFDMPIYVAERSLSVPKRT